MKYGMRFVLALGFVGAVAMGAVATGETGSAPEVESLDQSFAQTKSATVGDERGHRRGKHRGGLRQRMVHGEFKVALADGKFGTVTVDTGKITAINTEAKTVTIERTDGETVTVTAAEATRIRHNGEKATLSDLKVGDLARFVQRDDGSGSKVALIGAHTPKK